MRKSDKQDIRLVPIEKINPSPYNPRVDLSPADPEYQHIKHSIESFGYLDPIVWNERTGNIVSGHQRFKILVDSGLTEVECRVVDFDEEREKACNLAMNKATGLWDMDKLNALLDEMKGLDWDMSSFGFDTSSPAEDLQPYEPEGYGGDGEKSYRVAYEIIFNDEAEQDKWYEFLTYLRDKYPDAETISERIVSEICEVMGE